MFRRDLDQGRISLVFQLSNISLQIFKAGFECKEAIFHTFEFDRYISVIAIIFERSQASLYRDIALAYDRAAKISATAGLEEEFAGIRAISRFDDEIFGMNINRIA